MKNKIIIVSLCAAFLFAMAACKNGPKAQAEGAGTEEAALPAGEKTADEAAVADKLELPTFADTEAQKFVEEYAAFVEEYAKAYASDNSQKIRELNLLLEKYGKKTDVVVARLTKKPAEYQQFADFMKKMSDRLKKAQKGE